MTGILNKVIMKHASNVRMELLNESKFYFHPGIPNVKVH